MIAPACNWTVDQAGRTICATRRALYDAVVQATRLPSGEKRTAAVLAAMEAHAAHSCGPVEEGAASAATKTPTTSGASAGPKCICGGSPVHGEPSRTHPGSDGPVTLLSLHRHVLELSGAALVLGMRIERAAHPDAPADLEEKIREAEKRMEAASEALLRAQERYQPPLRRQPISAYLPDNEIPRG